MALRASGEQEDRDYDLNAVMQDQGDAGVAQGATIRRLVEATIGGAWRDLDGLRTQAAEAMGEQRMVDVLTVAAAFNGITRVADATGIPLDDATAAATETVRRESGIDQFDYRVKAARYG